MVTHSRMCPTGVVNWLLCWLLRSLLIPSSLYSVRRAWRLARLSAEWSSQATRSGLTFMLHRVPHYCARLPVNIWITCASEVLHSIPRQMHTRSIYIKHSRQITWSDESIKILIIVQGAIPVHLHSTEDLSKSKEGRDGHSKCSENFRSFNESHVKMPQHNV